MERLILVLSLLVGPSLAMAEDIFSEPQEEYQASDVERDPAGLSPFSTVTTKRAYPGGSDEEDLRVQTLLPEAALKTDMRTVQRDVYKTLYNQELKGNVEDHEDHSEE